MIRTLAVLVLAAALFATSFWRTPGPGTRTDSRIVFTDLIPQLSGPSRAVGPLVVTGAWDMQSAHRDFGGYSALARLADGRFAAVSDRGSVLLFTLPAPSAPPEATGLFRTLFPRKKAREKREDDPEAMTIDPADGRVWLAFEGARSYWTFPQDFTRPQRVLAPILLNWPGNAGPEALARLTDGRFVVLIEARESLLSRSRHPALLYPHAPHPREKPLRFTVEMPTGFRPTDAAPLPDGRLLVLGRDWGIGGYRSVLGIMDLAGLRDGTVVKVTELGRISDRAIRDNYEALAVEARPNGKLTVWLMSDNNQSFWLQRTLLLRLEGGLEGKLERGSRR